MHFHEVWVIEQQRLGKDWACSLGWVYTHSYGIIHSSERKSTSACSSVATHLAWV